MSTAAVRKQAPRLPRPAAVYRRGQAPKGVTAADLSDSDEDEDAERGEAADEDEEVADMPLRTVEDREDEEESEEEHEGGRRGPVKTATGKMNIALRDVDIKEGKVIVAGREESGRTAMEGEFDYILPNERD